jgi:hypothetical protein
MQPPAELAVEHHTRVFALVLQIFNAAREEGPLQLVLVLVNQLTRCSQVWRIYFEVLVSMLSKLLAGRLVDMA